MIEIVEDRIILFNETIERNYKKKTEFIFNLIQILKYILKNKLNIKLKNTTKMLRNDL